MGTQTTGGGSTTSFNNTPQAQGDYYLIGTEEYSGKTCFDVMANDLGGNAKILWSVDNSINESTTSPDLLIQDTARAEACSGDTSLNGAKIWITSDGKVGYDADSLSATFRSQLNGLAVGEVTYDYFTYAIRLANGTLSWTTVKIAYSGSNDGVVMNATASGSVKEDGTLCSTGTASFTDLDLSDTHTATASASATNTSALGTFCIGTVNEAANSANGSVSWKYDLDNDAAQHLACGQTVTEDYIIRVEDGHGGYAEQVVTIAITGTNDDPQIVAGGDDDGAVTEEGTVTACGTFDFTDVDDIDEHDVTVTPDDDGYVGALTAQVTDDSTGDNEGTVKWTFSVDNDDIDFLAEGQTLIQTYTVEVDDGQAGKAQQTVTITITGTNDKPVIATGVTGYDVTGAVTEKAEPNEGGVLSDSGAIKFTDVDATDTHTATFAAAATGYLGTFSLVDADPATPGVQTAPGSVGWSFSVDDADIDHLAAGQQLVQTYNVTIDDGHGGTVAQAVTVTITGTNDKPVIATGVTGYDVTGAVTEKAEPNEGGVLSDSGAIKFTDVDATDTHTATFAAAATGYLGTFSLVDADPATPGVQTAPGSVGWSFSVDDADIDHLAAGQQLVQTYNVTIDDGHGGTVAQAVTVTITGTNDKPVIATGVTGYDVTGAVTEKAEPNEGGVLSDSGAIKFTDVDATDTHTATFAAAATGYLGTFSLVDADPATPGVQTAPGSVGWSFSVDDADIDHLAAGQQLVQTYNVTIDDGHGGTVAQAVTVTITGTNDKPVIATGVTGYDVTGAVTEKAEPNEGGVLSDSGAIKFTDVDATDTHTATFAAAATGYLGTFSLVDADPATPGVQTAPGSVGWSFSVDDADIDHLAAGQQLVQTYNVTIDDGHGGTVAQAVTVTITGTNDKPVIATGVTGYDVTGAVTEKAEPNEGGVLSDSGAIKFTDVDATDTHTATFAAAATGYLGTFSLVDADPATPGVQTAPGSVGWSFSVDDADIDHLAAGQQLVQTYNVTIDDGHGGTVAQAVTVTITGTNDKPVIATGVTGYDVTGAVTEKAEPNEGGVLSDSGAIKFTDVDATDTHTATFAAAATGYLGTFSLVDADPATPGVQTAPGSVGWSFSVDDADIDHLAAGQQLVQTYNVTIDDGHGGTVAQAVTVTITGTNDAPDIQVNTTNPTDSAAATLTETNAALYATGTLTVRDTDLTDTVSPSVSGVVLSGTVGGLTAADVQNMLTLAPPTVNANPTDTHNLTWTFDSTPQAFDYLNPGQFLTLTYTVAVSDGHGGTDTQAVTITISGTADGDPNDNDGLVTGTTPVVMTQGNQGAQTLFGSTGNDVLMGGSGNDIMYGGAGDDFIYGYTGNNPPLDADGPSTGQDGDTIYGGSGNDTIFGNQRDDVIYGGSGNDTIDGGLGADSMTGGLGNDFFDFVKVGTDGNLTNYAVDQILDFSKVAANTDKIRLDDGLFTAIGALGALNSNAFKLTTGTLDADDRIIYNQATGELYYDADGSGSIIALKFAQLTAGTALTSTDFTVI